MKYFPTSQWVNMRKILIGEGAHGNSSAKGARNRNGSRDYGCFQYNFKHAPAKGWDNPDINAKWAYDLWLKAGHGQTVGWRRWCSADNMHVVKRAC